MQLITRTLLEYIRSLASAYDIFINMHTTLTNISYANVKGEGYKLASHFKEYEEVS